MITNIQDLLISQEGKRYTSYKDTLGNYTTGIGHLIKPDEQWMIGTTLTEDQIDELFADDLKSATLSAASALLTYNTLGEVRQAVIQSMVFNMGLSRLLEFKLFIAAVDSGEFSHAEDQMLDSLWAKQVPDRANQLAIMMITGDWPE